MNRLAEELAHVCDAYRLDEKRLVVPSLSMGHQLAETLVRSGHPWVNLHVETLRTLALRIIETDLWQEGKRVLSRAQALALVEDACAESLTDGGYFGPMRDQPGFHRILKGTLEDLRIAQVSRGELMVGSAQGEQKFAELRALIVAYERMLDDYGFIDDVGILRRALEKVRKGYPTRQEEPIYLVPDSYILTPPARQFLECLAGGRLHGLAADDPAEWDPGGKAVGIFRALGEENEIREILRRLLKGRIELDQVEILYTDGATYIPLIYELSAQYQVPCTMAEGVPVAFSRPGQAAFGYLDWIESDYDADCLSRLIGSDVLDLGKVLIDGDLPGSTHAASVLRSARVGRGQNRYVPCLDALIERCSRGVEKLEVHGHSESLGGQVAAARAVRSFLSRLLALTPDTSSDGTVTLKDLACGTAAFLDSFARLGGELDGMATSAVQDLLDELSTLPDRRLPKGDAVRRIRYAVQNTYVGASLPRPGHLHVGPYNTGGFSGRLRFFLVGLDESRHPGAGFQDPVLLDSERRRINGMIRPRRLALLRERTEENRSALRACFARLRGSLTLSYSCRNLLEDREQFPAAVILEVYRCLNQKPEADYSELESALEPPSGFFPAHDICLDDTEWWLRRLRALRPRDGEPLRALHTVYPWLHRGWQAQQARESKQLTVFDGWVTDSNRELDPRVNQRPVSCTEIEVLARCPFAYFLRHVLEVDAPARLQRDPSIWLDASELGRLLHEVFHAFMTDITARSERPQFARHWTRLKTVAEACVDRWRKELPPPSTGSFRTQRKDILLACETFLKSEETHCQKVTPCYFEVPFGLPTGDSPPSMGSRDPVSIDLHRGSGFLLRGRVDRVDRRDDDAYEVWDYKSGSPRTFREEKRLNRGRQIQHALYAWAAEILLGRSHQRARVVQAGYFFPGPRGEGLRITGEIDREALRQVLSDLLDILRDGVFLYAPDADFCGFCDYQVVCGGPEKANRLTHSKLGDERAGTSVLCPLRRLMERED